MYDATRQCKYADMNYRRHGYTQYDTEDYLDHNADIPKYAGKCPRLKDEYEP
jgi:hypothetical protein